MNPAARSTPYDQAAPDASGRSLQQQLGDALAKLLQMDSENTELRNKLITANDEIFLLHANSAVAEAEATVALQGDIAKLKSELNFRSQELFSLHQEQQKTLRELNAARQHSSSLSAVAVATVNPSLLGTAGAHSPRERLQMGNTSGEVATSFTTSSAGIHTATPSIKPTTASSMPSYLSQPSTASPSPHLRQSTAHHDSARSNTEAATGSIRSQKSNEPADSADKLHKSNAYSSQQQPPPPQQLRECSRLDAALHTPAPVPSSLGATSDTDSNSSVVVKVGAASLLHAIVHTMLGWYHDFLLLLPMLPPSTSIFTPTTTPPCRSAQQGTQSSLPFLLRMPMPAAGGLATGSSAALTAALRVVGEKLDWYLMHLRGAGAYSSSLNMETCRESPSVSSWPFSSPTMATDILSSALTSMSAIAAAEVLPCILDVSAAVLHVADILRSQLPSSDVCSSMDSIPCSTMNTDATVAACATTEVAPTSASLMASPPPVLLFQLAIRWFLRHLALLYSLSQSAPAAALIAATDTSAGSIAASIMLPDSSVTDRNNRDGSTSGDTWVESKSEAATDLCDRFVSVANSQMVASQADIEMAAAQRDVISGAGLGQTQQPEIEGGHRTGEESRTKALRRKRDAEQQVPGTTVAAVAVKRRGPSQHTADPAGHLNQGRVAATDKFDSALARRAASGCGPDPTLNPLPLIGIDKGFVGQDATLDKLSMRSTTVEVCSAQETTTARTGSVCNASEQRISQRAPMRKHPLPLQPTPPATTTTTTTASCLSSSAAATTMEGTASVATIDPFGAGDPFPAGALRLPAVPRQALVKCCKSLGIHATYAGDNANADGNDVEIGNTGAAPAEPRITALPLQHAESGGHPQTRHCAMWTAMVAGKPLTQTDQSCARSSAVTAPCASSTATQSRLCSLACLISATVHLTCDLVLGIQTPLVRAYGSGNAVLYQEGCMCCPGGGSAGNNAIDSVSPGELYRHNIQEHMHALQSLALYTMLLALKLSESLPSAALLLRPLLLPMQGMTTACTLSRVKAQPKPQPQNVPLSSLDSSALMVIIKGTKGVNRAEWSSCPATQPLSPFLSSLSSSSPSSSPATPLLPQHSTCLPPDASISCELLSLLSKALSHPALMRTACVVANEPDNTSVSIAADTTECCNAHAHMSGSITTVDSGPTATKLPTHLFTDIVGILAHPLHCLASAASAAQLLSIQNEAALLLLRLMTEHGLEAVSALLGLSFAKYGYRICHAGHGAMNGSANGGSGGTRRAPSEASNAATAGQTRVSTSTEDATASVPAGMLATATGSSASGGHADSTAASRSSGPYSWSDEELTALGTHINKYPLRTLCDIWSRNYRALDTCGVGRTDSLASFFESCAANAKLNGLRGARCFGDPTTVDNPPELRLLALRCKLTEVLTRLLNVIASHVQHSVWSLVMDAKSDDLVGFLLRYNAGALNAHLHITDKHMKHLHAVVSMRGTPASTTAVLHNATTGTSVNSAHIGITGTRNISFEPGPDPGITRAPSTVGQLAGAKNST